MFTVNYITVFLVVENAVMKLFN